MNADGSNARQLTDADYPWNDDPTWSPDGERIAFRANRGGFIDIYVMDAEGRSISQQLTHNAEIDQDRAPSWWPVIMDNVRTGQD
jgi:dipeptidyl aminopeptidase/acylaminoacyl peptidase